MNRSIQLACPAKVNLALEVGRLCLETRLHPIQSWMIAVDLYDHLSLTAADPLPSANGSTFDLSYAADAPSPRRIDWPLESDLVFRAHGLVQAKVNRELPVACRLLKSIPTGAGLGGGSSDAAGMICGLDELFDLRLTPDDLHELASQLGSDVHFSLAAMRGHPSAIVAGSGDRVRPVTPPSPPLALVLILPSFGCATGQVYQAFDRLDLGANQLDPERLDNLVEDENCVTHLFNDLAPAAIEIAPALGELLARIQGQLGYTPQITGSGSASFIVTDSKKQAEDIAAKVRDRLHVPAIAVLALSSS